MATDGLLILVSKDREEIQLHLASSEEYRLGPFLAAVRRARAENEKNGRNDLVAAEVNLDMPSLPGSVTRFAFHDIMCAGGYSDPIAEMSIEDFKLRGGIIEDRRFL